MFSSIRIGWIAANISERIESSTGYVIDSLITMGLHIKTHDTIFIFSKIYCMVTHNMYGKHLSKRGTAFVTQLDQRLRHDEKKWLLKVTQVPTDTTTISSFDVVFGSELDSHKTRWTEGYLRARDHDPNASSGQFTIDVIKSYLVRVGYDLPKNFGILQDHFERLDAVTTD